MIVLYKFLSHAQRDVKSPVEMSTQETTVRGNEKEVDLTLIGKAKSDYKFVLMQDSAVDLWLW